MAGNLLTVMHKGEKDLRSIAYISTSSGVIDSVTHSSIAMSLLSLFLSFGIILRECNFGRKYRFLEVNNISKLIEIHQPIDVPKIDCCRTSPYLLMLGTKVLLNWEKI